MRRLALVLALALAVAGARVAAACAGVDTDADGVCDDVDDCPAIANPDQSDVDGDLLGDPCDPVDGEITLPKIALRQVTLAIRGEAKGYLQTAGPLTTFEVATSVAVVMRDGGSIVLQATWPAAECIAIRGTTRCLSDDGNARLVVKPVGRTLGLFRVRARLKQGLTSASFPGPATVELTLGDLTYQGVATLCSTQARALTCRFPPG